MLTAEYNYQEDIAENRQEAWEAGRKAGLEAGMEAGRKVGREDGRISALLSTIHAIMEKNESDRRSGDGFLWSFDQ